MSFVLEAQRKQQSSEDPEKAARAAYAQAQASRHRSRRFIGVALVAVLAVAVATWYLWGSSAPASTATPDVAPPNIAPSVSLQTPKPQPAVTAKPEPKPLPPPPLKTLDRASPAAQEALLGFNYSSHIWGNDPETRTIGVDGRRLRTGETHNGWLLEEINENGVVWRRERERVQVPVLRMWESG